jgi:hypothetical protein
MYSQQTRQHIIKAAMKFEAMLCVKLHTDLQPKNIILVGGADFAAPKSLIFIDFGGPWCHLRT